MTTGVRSATVTRVIDALERAGCAPRRAGRGWLARCPAHADRTPSLNVSEGADGRVLMHCHAGCELQDILDSLELSRADLFQRVQNRRGGAVAAPMASRRVPRTRPRPPAPEVRAIWDACDPLDRDREASAWARARGLDPVTLADRDLCRALPIDARVPGWASLGGVPWSRGGYRLLFALYEAGGGLASLHGRSVSLTATPKGALPAGFAASGLVLADSAGLLMLETGRYDGPLMIAEGAPDFLSCACAWGDAAEGSAPAVIGILAGSWTAGIASRVPDGTRTVIGVHHDRAGEKYCVAIIETLTDRCELLRWRPPGASV